MALIFSQSLILSLVLLIPHLNALLYPPMATSLGLTSSVSYPFVEYLPDRKILMDWCFAMGYSVPGTLSAFYNVPIWPIKTRNRRDISFNSPMQNETSHFEWYEKYGGKAKNHHPLDLSAGELYQGIEDFFASFGFHETCLMRSVCELAQHPFDDQHSNLLTKVLTFILTPSWHQGFEPDEHIYRESYEAAELHGFLGEECVMLFPDCKRDLLELFSKVIFLGN